MADKGIQSVAANKSLGKRIVGFPQFGIIVVFVGLFVILSCMRADAFLTGDNMINVLRQTSTSLTVAIGMTFVLILGGIDLSVGSVANLVGALSAFFIVSGGMPDIGGIIVAVLIGVGLGFVNGIVIARLKIQPFIVTLAMMSSAKGLSLLISGGRPITGIGDFYVSIGRGSVGPVPIMSIIMIIILIIFWVVLSKTKFGRRVYASGGNEECARLSGINILKIKVITYVLCGLLASITGILLTARMGSSQPSTADGLEMDAISAAVLGGTTLSGGQGYMLGTIIGAFFLTILTNGFNIIGVSSYWQQVLKGIILIVAVVLYTRVSKTNK